VVVYGVTGCFVVFAWWQGANANLGVLRWLAYQTGGSAATQLSEPRAFADVLSGASAATVLTRLATDLEGDVEAWTDECLATVPDFRLSHLHHPAPVAPQHDI
jgi:hypothetical protein